LMLLPLMPWMQLLKPCDQSGKIAGQRLCACRVTPHKARNVSAL